MAEQNYGQIKSIEANEIIGDLIQVEPDVKAQSLIEITEDYVFAKHKSQGDIFSAQSNSLCVALIHNPTVLTQESQVEFVEKVKLNDTVRAEAQVINKTSKHYVIEVNSFVKDKLVLKGNLKCSI